MRPVDLSCDLLACHVILIFHVICQVVRVRPVVRLSEEPLSEPRGAEGSACAAAGLSYAGPRLGRTLQR